MKRMKKLLVTLLAGIMVLSSLTISAGAKEDEYDVFLAFGADKDASQDWGYGYSGADSSVGDVQGVDEKISVGETVTISATVPTETIYTWYLAPCFIAENVTALDTTITCKIDGTDVTDTIDFSAGDAWWYEGTGAYDETKCIRLAGGYNEWGTKYMATSPVFTTIEYTITLNSIEVSDGAAVATELSDFEGEAPVFVAIGADKDASQDWGYQYYGAGADSNAGDVTGVDGTISVGGTTTVSVEFPTASIYTWFVAPCVIAEGVVEADFTVQVFVDGTEVTPDFTAGDAWWYEGTGAYDKTQCIRLAGGYNEWGTKYIAESPANFSKIEFVITCNSMKVGTAAPAEDTATTASVDKNGVYHAYLGFQTPVYSFRNSFDDATYGRDTDFFNQVTGWEGSDAVTLPGTFTDVEIAGNGTYTVSVEGLNFPAGEFDTQDYMNLIFLSTDIPNSGEITISNVILKVNDKTIDLAENIGAIVSPDSVDYINMLLQNIWNDDVKTIGAYAVPPTSMSITFDVAGFDYDNTSSAVADDTTAADDTAAVTDTVKDSSSNSTVIIIIVIVVVVIAVVAVAVVLSKKKKDQK